MARSFTQSLRVLVGENAHVGLVRPLGNFHRLGSYSCGVAWNDGAWLSFALNWKSAQSTSHSNYLVVVCGPDNTTDYEDNQRRNYRRAEYLRGWRYRIAPAQP